MSTGPKLLLFLLTATFVAPETPTEAAPRPRLCTSGRFAVAGAPLLAPGGEVVVLENRALSIGTVCSARRARLRRRKRGTTVIVDFRKGDCPGIGRRVRLKALIADGCSTMTGTVKVRRAARVQFSAAASVCGDGVIDAGLGEECDGSTTGCGMSEVCNADCRCLVIRADKSSPIE